MKKDLMTIDGKSVLYASHYTKPLTYNGKSIQALFGFLKTLKRLKNENPALKPIVTWDGHADWRYSLLPGYKSSRGGTDEKKQAQNDVNRQENSLVKFLTVLGIDQWLAADYEADDLAGFIVRKYSKKRKILLVSGDRDWIQLVKDGVSWVDHRGGPFSKPVTTFNFLERTGFTDPRKYLEGKALIGDKSDTIDGAAGIGPKASNAIMTHYGSVQALCKKFKKDGSIGDKTALPADVRRAHKAITTLATDPTVFRRNLGIMNLLTSKRDSDIGKQLVVVKGEIDWDTFEKYCRKLEFNSILKDLKYWKETF